MEKQASSLPGAASVFTCAAALALLLQAQTTARENRAGPFNGAFIASGLGISKPLSAEVFSSAHAPWSMYCWFRSDGPLPSDTLIAGFGREPVSEGQLYFAIRKGDLTIWPNRTDGLSAHVSMRPNEWHFLAATDDGRNAVLLLDGIEVAHGTISDPEPQAALSMAPDTLPWPEGRHFAGKIAAFTLVPDALSARAIQSLYTARPEFDLLGFEAGSKSWPVQTHGQAGYSSPQDPSTLPQSHVPPLKPVINHARKQPPMFEPRGPETWAISGGWQLAAAPDIHHTAEEISRAGFRSEGWLPATVPGTVLTTYIDQGVYPDPDYGLNNLAIPEKLNKQDYWYRTEFTPPASLSDRHVTLTFEGINYAAAVWLNGQEIGHIKGAFIRGIFDVTHDLQPGKLNVLAVRISPPPHPGIPHEQSVKAGPGENGGLLCIDGPTFVATEGWDWIPGIRDRNSGLWQEVRLSATGSVRIGDTQVVTRLPLPATNSAEVTITVPLENGSNQPVAGELTASFEGVSVHKQVNAAPGHSFANFSSADFPELTVKNPRLWWPNGYGAPDLYHLTVSFNAGGKQSDSKMLRFGIREITYELSLLDHDGQLRRVEFSPTDAHGARVVDVSHEGMIESAAGWVASLGPDGSNSGAIHDLTDTRVSPYLAIRVNGVRIACKGGNWGMDDSRKRVSRDHLEPFFRLHGDANLNIIRNWVGQSTEEVFYDLADEYGLLVWNDFWDSTQDYNIEPDDAALFLANARDTIQHYRNHPSIVMWCGRNEGVPAPAVNEGLDQLVRALDGTRYYSPSSNSVNLQFSGPYEYKEPSEYFTKHARGFAVELGVPSMPTIDSFRSFVPLADQWPPSDTWAYHDWHVSGNGRIKPFMDALDRQFGASTSLEDFERKAQMLNYVEHRAIFEGFNAHLWNPNSARMLWMTQPAWPSTMWQILSSDYDTQASFYGVKKASEPVHVQLNLPDLVAAAVNNTTQPLTSVKVTARVFSRNGTALSTQEQEISVGASAEVDAFRVDIPEDGEDEVTLIKLQMTSQDGRLLSDNFYWQAPSAEAYRDLVDLPAVALKASASEIRSGDSVRVSVDLLNESRTPALMSKMTLRHLTDSSRVLPAYATDNYISLLPGEKRHIDIDCPADQAVGELVLGLSGWNIKGATIPVAR